VDVRGTTRAAVRSITEEDRAWLDRLTLEEKEQLAMLAEKMDAPDEEA
jgi:hypothetical protein